MLSNSAVTDELPAHPGELAQVPDGVSRTQVRTQVPPLFTQCSGQHLLLTSYPGLTIRATSVFILQA